ncbi:MAG: glycosyltransferase family 4 protein [Candidatus Buchananbacteria bacterium]
MKLLILTQKVDKNDDLLGFFGSWINEFAKHCEQVTVVCLFEGVHHDFLSNVKIIGLGKEKISLTLHPIVRRIIFLYRFLKISWQERKNYDIVFVHMNIIYVLCGGWLWRLLGKKIGLWHAHGKVRRNLKAAEKISNFIFTSTKEGCRLDSPKVKIVGQGIDVDRFHPVDESKSSIFKIITIGRISPVKDYETLIAAAEILRDKIGLSVDIIGGIGLADQEKYFQDLKSLVTEKKLDQYIKFLGPIANSEIVSHLQSASLFVNMSHTGSMDKAILEAMATGLPVITCNEALFDTLEKYKDQLIFSKGDFAELAEKIFKMMSLNADEFRVISSQMRQIMVDNHDVKNLVKKIMANYQQLYG